jgi:hypothetical protein
VAAPPEDRQGLTMNALIPILLPALVLFGLHKWRGVELWVLVVAVVVGIVLSGTVIGADISNILSQLSGGRIH